MIKYTLYNIYCKIDTVHYFLTFSSAITFGMKLFLNRSILHSYRDRWLKFLIFGIIFSTLSHVQRGDLTRLTSFRLSLSLVQLANWRSSSSCEKLEHVFSLHYDLIVPFLFDINCLILLYFIKPSVAIRTDILQQVLLSYWRIARTNLSWLEELCLRVWRSS